jgi:hypothetical protein
MVLTRCGLIIDLNMHMLQKSSTPSNREVILGARAVNANIRGINVVAGDGATLERM